MGKYKPGEIVTIKGTEFAVLDVEEGTAKDNKDQLFVLLKEPTDITAFGATNNYGDSVLRKKVNEWFKKYEAAAYDHLIYSHRVSLLTMNGREDYGNTHFWAAPLTFDEWRKYSLYIPDCEKGYWLATGDNAPCRDGAKHALVAYSGGDWYIDYCSNSHAVRPAMRVSAELVDEPKEEPKDEKPDLSEYSTMELIQELAERVKENDVE